jgi:hypothetical protein
VHVPRRLATLLLAGYLQSRHFAVQPRCHCKNGESSALRVRGSSELGFGVSWQSLSPNDNTWGPPSGIKTRAHVYGTRSGSDWRSASRTTSMRRSWVRPRVALSKASASADEDWARARLVAPCSSASFCAVISRTVPTRRTILPPASRTGKPCAQTQRTSPLVLTIRSRSSNCPFCAASWSFRKHVNTVVGVNDFFVRRGILHQRLARTPADGLIGLVDVKSFLALGIDHPEDLLDIARHLVEFMLCRLDDACRVALVPAQLEQHFSQKKAEKTKGRCHGD